MADSQKLTLIERLLVAGYPKDEIHHHDSDLYVFITPLTQKVIEDWVHDNGWKKDRLSSFLIDTFTDQITGRPMYDIAFQFSQSVLDGWKGDTETCKFCHQTPEFVVDFFDEWGSENNIDLAKGSWTSLCIGVDRDGNTVLRAFGDGIAEYYPKFCPECGRKLRD